MIDVIEDVRNEFKVKLTDNFFFISFVSLTFNSVL